METVDVYAAGISGKVARITLGGLLSCHWLPDSQGDGTAEFSRGHDRLLTGN